MSLLFYMEVMWLSPGNTTMRLFELRKKLLQFFQRKDHKFQKILEDENFILHLAYLPHIFGVENHFGCSLQGPESNTIDFSIKLIAFTQKLDLWIKNIQNRQFGMFENVASLAREPCIAFGQEIIKHLLLLQDEIKQYFFNDGDALTFGIHSLSSLAIFQWELMN